MFLQQPYFFSHPNLKYHYKDINFGFTPTGGTTNFLKTLVPCYGKFLSLTGQSMNVDELKVNNAVYAITENNEDMYKAGFHHEDIHDNDIVQFILPLGL